MISFVLSLWAWSRYGSESLLAANGPFHLTEQYAWYDVIKSTFHLGVDGIALVMVLLTTLLMPLVILASFKIEERVKAYMILFLLLETGMLGVFMSLDLLLFFAFWEVGLVPMYFLIAQWGGANRNYASLKFILFTMAGSLGLLLAIQMIGVLAGTFDMAELFNIWPSMVKEQGLFGIQFPVIKNIAFWAFVIAFAVKVPVWPFHTWLPDAHTEAPTGGSMILAGVLLKLGAFGFLRLVLPLFPAEVSPIRALAGRVGHAGDCLWSVGRIRAGRFQTPGGLLLDQPYGLCGSGDRGGGAGPGHRKLCYSPQRRGVADVQPRPVLGGDVLPGGGDL